MTHAITLERNSSAISMQSIVSMMLCCLLVLSCFMFLSTETAFCTGADANAGGGTSDAASNIQNAVTDGTNQIFQVMRAIVTPICIVLIGFSGFQFLLGGQQGTEKARKTLVAAGLGIAVVLLAPLFGQAIATWFADSASGDLSQYNPII